ncbi:MAG: aminomethyl-transferring glycine dehydrogenase subunit GcvPA [Clostridia bacterium]|nr:aminomethyl-transferring glycine dehydrogenase subunit GcvPA [Clostridia bacterium]
MGSYIQSTKAQQQEMLQKIGCKSIEELFSNVPSDVALTRPLNIPEGMSEVEVMQYMQDMADENTVFKTVLRGAGAYRHYIPAIVKSVVTKEEFVTAYTPYQAEMSQGILQSIFEYQTMICSLTGMDVSNASVYDGASAAAEAVAMCRERKRAKAFVSACSNPDVIETIKTYCSGNGMSVELIPEKDGVTDLEALKSMLCDDLACVYIAQPNYYGIFENLEEASEITHSIGAKLIAGCNPIALSIIKTPFEAGADIAVGEGQPLGMPLSFGGPYLGFMAATNAMMRKLPGRIVGETVDHDGRRAYVLTLQAREQHIRREKASSNICSNQAHCALTAAVYMSAMGADGMKEVATQSMSKAHYLKSKLESIGFESVYDKPFFHEFVTTGGKMGAKKALEALEKNGILGGLLLDDDKILWCATEVVTKKEIDKAVAVLEEVGK